MAELKTYPKLARYQTAGELRDRWAELGWTIPCDDEILTAEQGSPLVEPMDAFGRRVGNRWCVHPMEGWDGTLAGGPTDWTRRRWRHFGLSGAKLIWGCEAVAVRHDGRANPNQLRLGTDTQSEIASLREELIEAHQEATGSTDDLVVGLQLTHSGRFCRPDEGKGLQPRIAYHHPILDARFGIEPDDDSIVFTDDELLVLMDDYVAAAKLTAGMGFDFVDLKCCHGYLGHELLGAFVRPGRFGGSFENRTRFIRELIGRVRDEVPGLAVGVRVSAFDFVPFEDDPATRQGNKKGAGIPAKHDHLLPYRYAFGVNPDNPLEYDLAEPIQLLETFESLGVDVVNVSCGSPYYNPHIQRPAAYPPSDGYQPPEDPLIGVAQQIDVVRQLKQHFPSMVLVGTGYTYLQEFLPMVAQAVVREGWVDSIGIGRMVLSYPQMPIDSLQTGKLNTRRICRTFSDCTTAPRKGLRSGCYPLDEEYKRSDQGRTLKDIKRSS